MHESIWTGFQTEGDPAFPTDEQLKEKETETPSESSNETNEKEAKPSEEGETKADESGETSPATNTPPEKQVPFNEHPRWKQIYDENKRLKEQVESQMREQQERLQKIEERTTVPSSVEIPDWFKETFGDNADLYQKYKREEDKRFQEVQERMERQRNEAYEQEQRTLAQANEYVASSIGELRSEGLLQDENAFRKFILDYHGKYGAIPEDGYGNIDFRRSLSLFNEINSAKVEAQAAKAKARKTIASDTESAPTNTPSEKPKEYMTAKDLRNVSWY